MKETLRQPFNGQEAPVVAPDQRICVYCANRQGEVCGSCFREARYRGLVPEALAAWEAVPELPSFKELLEMPAAARLAFVYLGLHYLVREKTRE